MSAEYIGNAYELPEPIGCITAICPADAGCTLNSCGAAACAANVCAADACAAAGCVLNACALNACPADACITNFTPLPGPFSSKR